MTAVPTYPSDLATAMQQYLELVEALGQAVIVTTASGTVTYWGAAAAALYGWSEAEVLGRNIVDVTPTDLSRSEASAIMQTLTAGALWSGRFVVCGRDGRPFTAAVTDVPVIDVGGTVRGIVGVSAIPSETVDLVRLARRLAVAAAAIWPGRVTLDTHLRAAAIRETEPHALQLLSLMLVRFAGRLNAGGRVRMTITQARRAPVAEFVPPPLEDAIYVGLTGADGAERRSVLREVRDPAEPSYFARSLLEQLGGTLLIEGDAEQGETLHLVIPRRR